MIRHATKSDAEAIHAVRMAAIQGIEPNHYSLQELNDWCIQRSVTSYLQPIHDQVVLVAEFDGTVVGFAQLNPKLREVQALYVHPAHARRGIGTALLNALEIYARSHGIAELYLDASLNAIEFYANAGYRASLQRHKLNQVPSSQSMRMARILADSERAA